MKGVLINTEIFRFAQDDKLWWVQLFKSCHAERSEASPNYGSFPILIRRPFTAFRVTDSLEHFIINTETLPR
jgi:hypothetical protein